jgi:hypothetical protein
MSEEVSNFYVRTVGTSTHKKQSVFNGGHLMLSGLFNSQFLSHLGKAQLFGRINGKT